MHIRNCQIQKTQPAYTAKKKRKREKVSMFNKMIISKQTPQTIHKIENPRGYGLGTVRGKTRGKLVLCW
jgi:hypothetical protein